MDNIVCKRTVTIVEITCHHAGMPYELLYCYVMSMVRMPRPTTKIIYNIMRRSSVVCECVCACMCAHAYKYWFVLLHACM